jgi:hypothetical protein
MFNYYVSWKYPNTSSKLGKFIFLCLIICLAIQLIFFAQQAKHVRKSDLQIIPGSIEMLKIPSNNNENIAVVRLREYPNRQFSFHMSSYSGTSSLQVGDFITILASKMDLENNSASIASYELKRGEFLVFSFAKFKESETDNVALGKFFLWIVIALLVLYLVIEKAGLINRLQKLMDSPDNNFQPNKPNFNEFLDR